MTSHYNVLHDIVNSFCLWIALPLASQDNTIICLSLQSISGHVTDIITLLDTICLIYIIMEPMHNNKKANDYEWLVDVVVVVGGLWAEPI